MKSAAMVAALLAAAAVQDDSPRPDVLPPEPPLGPPQTRTRQDQKRLDAAAKKRLRKAERARQRQMERWR